jgi:hypothetical protein
MPAMLAALVALVLAAGNAPPGRDGHPVVALLPLRPLGVPADVVRALEVTLRNELSAQQEARLAPEKDVAEALKREPDCEARITCLAQAAAHAGARQLIIGTASQLGDSFMIDLKLLDARTSQELRRATHPVSGSQDALIETLREAAVQLLAPARFVGAMKIEVPGAPGATLFVDGKAVGPLPRAMLVEGLTPGQHTVRVADGKTREASAFVEVRFGKTTEARIDLAAAGPAQVVRSVPAAALPSVSGTGSQRQPWMRPAALAGLGLGVASAVVGVVYHARAYATAADLNRREALNQLQPADVGNYAFVDHETRMARGFYVAAALLAAAGGGLLWWDLRADGVGVQGKF